MKKTTILVGLFVFLSLGFSSEIHAAGEKVIVNATAARVRSAPNLTAKVLGATKIGMIYSIAGKRGDWYNISYKGKNDGWISGTIAEPFDDSRRTLVYQKLADKYLNRPKLEFNDAAELFEFLTNIQKDVAQTVSEPDLAFKRLVALAAALEVIPIEKSDQNPYKKFAEANESEIVFSEPSGQYYVIADKFWDLREKYSTLPIAEEIAWKAARTYLPGECEGYLPCHLYYLRDTDGKYLEYYPKGKHSGEAVQNVVETLNGMADDAKVDSGYYITEDADDRANLEKFLSELREIVAKTSSPLSPKIFGYLEQIKEYKPRKDEENNDSEIDAFWNSFKTAVIKTDKNAVAELTKFPLAMPFGQQSVKTKAELLKRYDQVFNGETDAAKCFENAELIKEEGRYGVYCGFKTALEDENNKPIYYYFEKSETGWKFAGLDNINE